MERLASHSKDRQPLTEPINETLNGPDYGPEDETLKYRKKRGTDTWHWCRNCSKWPTFDYDEQDSKPTSGELDNECKAKEANGTCRS